MPHLDLHLSHEPDPHHERRWTVLILLSATQLLVVLDATIVNVALPSAQASLGFSDDQRQWVITAYALAFGSLLLLGGRLGDLFGRKWAFVIGLVGFAVASAMGGASGSFGQLVGARALQGAFGALLAPAGMALLATIFVDPRERGKAFGAFGVVASAGGAVGLLLGGVLTQWLSWRWCLYVNLLIAVPAAFFSARLLFNQPHPDRPPLDLLGTFTATTGLFALVYGFSSAATDGWGATPTIVALALSVVLLAANVFTESRAEHPLLPPRVVRDRNRGGSFLALGIAGIAGFAYFLFLTYYLQQTLGLSPVQTGLAFLPLPFMIGPVGMMVNVRFLRTIGPRPLLTTGMALGAVAMVLLAQLDEHSTYWADVLPALLIVGVGMGMIFGPGFASATYGVRRHDAGVASATANVVQQVGGAVGTSALSAVFASVVAAYLVGRPDTPAVQGAAAIHGYSTVFWIAAGVYAFGAVVVGFTMESIRVEDPLATAAA